MSISPPDDIAPEAEDRGPWMQTSSGGRFWPLDPRPEDIHIQDIANGLASERRYNGQALIDEHYSVAEHSVLMAWHAREVLGWSFRKCLYTLLHDAAEAYVKDQNRATKAAMRSVSETGTISDYDAIYDEIELAILAKFGFTSGEIKKWYPDMKELDCRIIMDEKPIVMPPCHHEWAFEQFEPLGVQIRRWPPPEAKRQFLATYEYLTRR